ncbi:hypothetical protein HALDL1_04310 [Halobacterium sp. DL1]|nr:hypothetical protein HALDL1_04310 [Halobacterium sp. DL1]
MLLELLSLVVLPIEDGLSDVQPVTRHLDRGVLLDTYRCRNPTFTAY